jgi:hypothetical protein
VEREVRLIRAEQIASRERHDALLADMHELTTRVERVGASQVRSLNQAREDLSRQRGRGAAGPEARRPEIRRDLDRGVAAARATLGRSA